MIILPFCRPLLPFFLLLTLLTEGRAQTLVYPVRSGHKWGYVNLRGKWMIRPRYEAFSETDLPWNIHPEVSKASSSPYRLVESDGKVGLTDRTLREVLPCQYKRIRPISRHWFAVETDSLFTLVNSKGEVMSQERFDDICGMDTLIQRRNERFFVKKNGRWGVYQVGAGIIIPIRHEDIASAYSPQYYRVKVPGKSLWSLINAQNQPVLSGEYMDIKAISKDFIALLPEGQNWVAVDERGTPLFDPKWVRLEVLNRHHVWVQDIDQRSALWNVQGRKWVAGSDGSQEPSTYFPIDDRFVAPYLFGAKGLIDSNGMLLVPPRFYDSITLSGLPDYYRVRNLSRNWGLLRAGVSTPVLSCRFMSLGRFSDSLTIACGDLGCGVFNGRLQELITPTFERIEREGDTLNVYGTDDQLLRYRIERGGRVTLLEAFEDVMQIRIGTDKNFVEARALHRSSSIRSDSRRWLRGRYISMSRDSNLLWKNDFGDWKLLRRRNGDYVERLYAQFSFCHMEALTPQDLCAVYRQDLTAKGRLAQTYAPDAKALSRFGLFRFSTGKFVTGPDFQGIRAEDLRLGYPYAPFIDTLGRMGLVDAAGQVLARPDGLPLRFTYIGDFVYGLARVCVGGVLRQIKMDEDLPAVEPYHTFPLRFGLLDPTSKSGEYASGRPLVVAPTEKSRPRWGFIDTLGQVVIEPRYDFAESFNADTMAVVRRGDSLGLVNPAGVEVIPCRYLRVLATGDGFYKVALKNPSLFYYNQLGHQYCPPRYDRYLGFAEGLCLVRRDSAWGYMDSTGSEHIACRFALARHFSEGRAAVVEGGEWVFIDTSGAVVFRSGLAARMGQDLGSFSEGMCRFRADRRWGYYDRLGNKHILPAYGFASDFRQGVAVVRTTDRYGVIDTAGQYVVKPMRYIWIGLYNQYGLAQMREVKDGPLGLLNTSGQVIAAPRYISIDTFFGGFARVRTAAGWGLLNRRGEVVIEPGAFAGLTRVSEGLLGAKPHLKDEWYILDTLGKKVLADAFASVGQFDRGFAIVNQNQVVSRAGRQRIHPTLEVKFMSEGMFGVESSKGAYFGDAAGENLFGRYFEEVKPFQNGIGKVRKQGKWGAVNRRGVALVRPKFNFVHPQPDGNLIVRPPHIFGLMDKTGQMLVPPEYDSIERMEGLVFKLELGEQVGYLRQNGKWMWPMGN